MQTPDELLQSSSASCATSSSIMTLPLVSSDSVKHPSDEFPTYESDGDMDDDEEEEDDDDYPEPTSTSETRHLIAAADDTRAGNQRPPTHLDDISATASAVKPLERRHRTTAGHGRPRRMHAYASGSTGKVTTAGRLRRQQRSASKLYSPLTVFTLTIVFLLFLYIPLFNTFHESSGMCE